MKYRKKPVEIEAFQMTEARRKDNSEWPNWLNMAWNEDRGKVGSVYPAKEFTGDGLLCVMSLQGANLVSWNDWIIKNGEGDLYACKPDIFEQTYELVEC